MPNTGVVILGHKAEEIDDQLEGKRIRRILVDENGYLLVKDGGTDWEMINTNLVNLTDALERVEQQLSLLTGIRLTKGDSLDE